MRAYTKIYSDAEYDHHFYPKHVTQNIERLHEFLPESNLVHIFPEMTIKSNNMPNGILIESQAESTIFLPTLLRDPGCGFLILNILDVDKSKIEHTVQSLLDYLNKEIVQQVTTNFDSVKDAMQFGVNKYSDEYQNSDESCYETDLTQMSISLSEEKLLYDLNLVTNSVEVKITSDAIYSSKNKVDLIAFIHSGSNYLPERIYMHWILDSIIECKKHYNENKINTLNELYGIPIQSECAFDYRQTVYAAMNFCKFKRYYLFKKIQEFLKKNLLLETSIMNDKCHAGIFQKNQNDKLVYMQSRGVQIVNHLKNKMVLMAGQKESISLMLSMKDSSYVGHGTSYQIDPSIKQKFNGGLNQLYPYSIYANTSIDEEKLAPYNFNINKQAEYFHNIIETQTVLFPLMNYQGLHLKRAECTL